MPRPYTRKKQFGGNRVYYSIKNKYITLDNQCNIKNSKKLNPISAEDDFHRSNLFLKYIRDKKPIPLNIKALPPQEEAEFINEWRNGLNNREKKNNQYKEDPTTWSINTFLGLKGIDYTIINNEYKKFSHGLSIGSEGALLAFDCKLKSSTFSGELDRHIYHIMLPDRLRDYAIDYDTYKSPNRIDYPSLSTGNITPNKLENVNICIIQNDNELTINEDLMTIPYIDTMYIFTDNDIMYTDAIKNMLIKGKYLLNIRLLQDLIAGNHILDIHPRLIFLMYTDSKARPLLDQIFGGNLLPKGRLRFTSDEQAAFFWALCWEYYHNPRTLKKNLDDTPFYSTSYVRKWALIDAHYREHSIDDRTERSSNRSAQQASPVADEVIERILETTDWAMRGKGTVAAQRKRRMADRDIFRALFAQLPRPTDAELGENVYRALVTDFTKRGISKNVILPHLTGSKPSNSSNNKKLSFGGAMPDFYKYYLPELTASPTTCKLPASAKALEKIPALSLEQMFKRALLFWKRVQDGLPVPINERALPAAEEGAFIRAWQGAIAGKADSVSASADRSAQPALPAADEEAASLEFLRATEATKTQYESEFNNVSMPLSAFDCKRKPDGSLSFNRLIGYIMKTATERQYAFEANVLGAEFGTLAAGAVGLSTVAFVSDRETPVQYQTGAGKTAAAAPATETLFIQTGPTISYQARPGKPYIVPGDALLKAALPRAAFTQRAVVDLHPKVAYFLWRDPKLRKELLLPCFGEAFLPSFRAIHKSLKGYENEFAAVYYQLCYEAAHWVPRGELIESNAAYYGGNNEDRVPSAGLFPLTPAQSPRGSIVEETHVINRSAASPQSVISSVPPPSNNHTKTPANFYRLPNSNKYAKIIKFLQANPGYTLPSLQWTTPKRGFFSRLFTRKRKPIMNVLRNLKKQPANKTNSIVLEMLFTKEDTGPMVLQSGGRRLNITRRTRK